MTHATPAPDGPELVAEELSTTTQDAADIPAAIPKDVANPASGEPARGMGDTDAAAADIPAAIPKDPDTTHDA